MKNFFDLLFQHGVTPNGLLVLQMKHTGDAYPNFINSMTEERRLVFSKHLLETRHVPENSGHTQALYTLSDKGRHFLREAELAMGKAPKAKKLKAIPFEEWEDHIKQYLAMFPSGTQGSAVIRVPPKVLYERFQ